MLRHSFTVSGCNLLLLNSMQQLPCVQPAMSRCRIYDTQLKFCVHSQWQVLWTPRWDLLQVGAQCQQLAYVVTYCVRVTRTMRQAVDTYSIAHIQSTDTVENGSSQVLVHVWWVGRQIITVRLTWQAKHTNTHMYTSNKGEYYWEYDRYIILQAGCSLLWCETYRYFTAIQHHYH